MSSRSNGSKMLGPMNNKLFDDALSIVVITYLRLFQ
jgi:hypothetical protein